MAFGLFVYAPFTQLNRIFPWRTSSHTPYMVLFLALAVTLLLLLSNTRLAHMNWEYDP